ncbi:MAG TPA: class I SAM-dependent methyltransferase [Silvibacterium sp.]|nr:class I SAM-dependent methyltransferase [Silvibacterium sp.]
MPLSNMQGKHLLLQAFSALDRAGLHVIPKHYYSPVPDCAWLRRNQPLWTRRSSLTGIHWDLAEQFSWLADICEPYYAEVSGLKFYNLLTQNRSGPGYGPVESQVLHCFIRTYAPAGIVEIGSGVSTMCMLEAARLNQRDGKRESKITCVEPFPSEKLRSSNEIHLLPQLCQQVPASYFEHLSGGDLLFIDSTHAVKVGSDVLRIYLEIVPRLPAGVFIHIHDIFLPYAYPRNVFTRPFWWQETALLIALLVNNSKLKVLSCLSALHYDYAPQMQALMSDYLPARDNEGILVSDEPSGHFPSSIWLQTA